MAGDNHSLAGNLRDYLQVLADALPSIYLSPGLDPLLLRAETRDAVVYMRDSGGRRSVEESRIMVFAPTCARAYSLHSYRALHSTTGPPRVGLGAGTPS